MAKHVISDGLQIVGGLTEDLTGRILTIQADGTITDRPTIDVSSYVTTELLEGNVFIGSNANVITSVDTAVVGNILADETNGLTIKDGVITNSMVHASAAIALSKLASLTADYALVSSGAGVISVSNVPSTVLGYIATLSSDAQDQIDGKQATITGAATTIVVDDLDPDKVLVSSGSGKITESDIDTTELSYLDGASSNLQTQLDNKLTVSFSSPADGDIAYRLSGQYVNLPIGAENEVLTSVGGFPVWSTGVANGIPSGGDLGDYLAKASGDPYDVEWVALTISKVTDISASADDINLLEDLSDTVTSTNLGFLSGLSANAQTQITDKLGKALSYNAIFVGNASNLASQLAGGTNGQVFKIVGSSPQWVDPAATGNVSGPSAGTATDNAIARFNNIAGDSIQNSGILIDDSNNIIIPTGSAIQTSTSAGNTVLFQAYDVDGAAYVTFATLTANNTPTFDLASAVTIGGAAIYRVGGTDVSLADGGTGASLADPGADSILAWDDVDGAVGFWLLGTGLSYDHLTHTLSATSIGSVSSSSLSTDNAVVRWDGLTGTIIQDSAVIVDDSNNVSGVVILSATDVRLATGGALKTSTSAGNTVLFQAYDVDGAAYVTFATLTANNTPTFDLASAVTIGGAAIYRVGGTDVSLADGGTGTSLADPGADRILFWDESGNVVTWLQVDTELEIVGTTLGIATNGVGDTHIRQSSGLSVIGRTTNSTGNVADITAGTDAHVLRRSGTSIGFGQIGTASISAMDTDGTLAANSDTVIATQKAVKTYADTKAVSSQFIGTQDLYIPAAAMWPTTTNGAQVLTRVNISTSLVNIQTLDFDQTTQEFVQFSLSLPRNWNNGTVTAKVYWTAASGTGSVVWGVSGGAYSDDDALSTVLGTAQTVTDTLITANDVHISSYTSAITIAGTPADGDLLFFKISRNPADGSDTLTADAKLLGVVLTITTDAGTA